VQTRPGSSVETDKSHRQPCGHPGFVEDRGEQGILDIAITDAGLKNSAKHIVRRAQCIDD
jgi:hypothetical protein